MGNSEATENDEAAAHAREVREAVQDLAERGTYVEAAFMGRMLAARREIEKALAEGRSPGIDCTHMDDEEFMALIHASAVPDSLITPIPNGPDDPAAYDRETRDLAQAIAQGGTHIDQALLGRLLAAKREIGRAMEEGRPIGISWSTLTEEEKMTLLRGGFTAEEREAMARRGCEPIDRKQGN